MNTLEITKHFGRLGNNMVYIINAIDYCLTKNINRLIFNYPKPSNNHSLNIIITKNYLDIITYNEDITENIQEKHWGHYFYSASVEFYKRIYIVQKYIVPISILKPNLTDENSLVIHLRGGDIFQRGHYAYIQPPISFYENIINSKKWNKIYLISEDNRNPCFDILKNKYNCITYLKNNKSENFILDLEIMIGATNFVSSKSSLSPFIIQLSKSIKNVYLANFYLDEPHKRINNTKQFEKNENQIWWSNDLKNRIGEFDYYNIHFNVLNYTNFISLFNEKNFDLSQENNKKLLLLN